LPLLGQQRLGKSSGKEENLGMSRETEQVLEIGWLRDSDVLYFMTGLCSHASGAHYLR
jgi:hypothetical protein